MDYCKDNQVVAPTATAVADLVSLLEQIDVATIKYMVYGHWSGECVLSNPNKKRDSETVGIHVK